LHPATSPRKGPREFTGADKLTECSLDFQTESVADRYEIDSAPTNPAESTQAIGAATAEEQNSRLPEPKIAD
jgi:hypothetical protein